MNRVLVSGLTFLVLLLVWAIEGEAAKGDHDVDLSADVTVKSAEPGEEVKFEVMVNNTGNLSDTFELTMYSDARQWATFQSTGGDYREITLDPGQRERVWVVVSLPDCNSASGADRDAIEADAYFFEVQAVTSDYNASDLQGLEVDILPVHIAELSIYGTDTIVTYPALSAGASERQEKFTVALKNVGNRPDWINLSVVETTYPEDWSVGVYTNIGCTTPYSNTTVNEPGISRYLILCVTPDQGSEAGNITLMINISPNEGREDPVTVTATLDVRKPVRRFILQVDETEMSLEPEEGDDTASTARFKITNTNTGSHDDRFLARLDTSLGDDWQTTTGEADDWFFTNRNGGIVYRWKAEGQIIENGGSHDDLWFIVKATEDVESGNYTLRVTINDASDNGTPQTLIFVINVEAPRHSLEATIQYNEHRITPRYGASNNFDQLKFKVTLVNTGSLTDRFIPEVESTLNSPDWDVDFYEDSEGADKWPHYGMDMGSGDTDYLWIFVLVDDEAEEGLYPITISIQNEDGHPDARKEVELIVNVTRPDLMIEPGDMALEINGAEADSDFLHEGSSLKVLLDVHNRGLGDADYALVEIYLFPKSAPEYDDFDTINELEGMGFDYDEALENYILRLESSRHNFRAGHTKEIVSDDWIVEGGEWRIGVRLDHEADDEKGQFPETNENNNDAVFPDLLQISPDLSITSMRVDNKYITKAPNVDDVVTFTVTVRNDGAANVEDARLYIWNDNAPPYDMLKERTSRMDYLVFDVAALDEKTVRFKWEAQLGEWTGFRAEVNPRCVDIGEYDEPNCDAKTGRFIDELDRYNNNEYPTGGGEFKQQISGANITVQFLIWPDFVIKEIDLDPSRPERDGDDVTIKVTIENIGAGDWSTGMGTLKLRVDDGWDYQEEMSITKGIDADDEVEFELKKKWKTPDVDKVEMVFELDYNGEELDDRNNRYEDPDTDNDYLEVNLKYRPCCGPPPRVFDEYAMCFLVIGLTMGLACGAAYVKIRKQYWLGQFDDPYALPPLIDSHGRPVRSSWGAGHSMPSDPWLTKVDLICPKCRSKRVVPRVGPGGVIDCKDCGFSGKKKKS